MNENKGAIKKMMIILSKASIENVEGIESEIFFTFFGLEAVHKKRMDSLHVATVGNPAMHIPTMLGGLPGMEAFATSMMKKEMEKVDMPEIPEFLDIMSASGVKMWACKLAFDMFHYKKEDLYEGVNDIITVGDFYKKSEGEGVHMLFI